MEPCLLAFDTSTERLAAGLTWDGGLLTREEAGGALASSRLIGLLTELLTEAGRTWRDLDAIAFGAGPGAFTGLRAACAVAQGLGFGAGRPLLALDSLLVVADDAQARHPATDADTLHWVAIDARIDEVYAAAYRREGRRWQVVHAPALYTLDAIGACWQATPPARVAGNATTTFAPRLPFGGAECIASVGDRAGALLRLARDAWNAGARLDPAEALPVYLRDKVALTSAERALARGERL